MSRILPDKTDIDEFTGVICVDYKTYYVAGDASDTHRHKAEWYRGAEYRHANAFLPDLKPEEKIASAFHL